MFGPDGYLYAALGDGGSGGDPQNRAQDTGNLFGKILRLDINKGDPYSIPLTNPFANEVAPSQKSGRTAFAIHGVSVSTKRLAIYTSLMSGRVRSRKSTSKKQTVKVVRITAGVVLKARPCIIHQDVSRPITIPPPSWNTTMTRIAARSRAATSSADSNTPRCSENTFTATFATASYFMPNRRTTNGFRHLPLKPIIQSVPLAREMTVNFI